MWGCQVEALVLAPWDAVLAGTWGVLKDALCPRYRSPFVVGALVVSRVEAKVVRSAEATV